MSWRETERGKDEGNIQLPTMADARMDYKAPIEPKDVDATIGTIFLGTIVPIPTWLGQIGLVIVNDGGDTS